MISRIKKDENFKAIHSTIDSILDPKNFIGRAERQTEEFIETEIQPILEKNKKSRKISAQINV